MKKYLAVDSGGTKVVAIVYDEAFQPVKEIRIGSCRGNTTSEQLVEENLRQFLEKLNPEENPELELVSGVADPAFMKCLKKHCVVHKEALFGEVQAGLYAAEMFGDGVLAIAGTGSQLAAVYQGKVYQAGAYGAAISDYGSGYWIGRRAMAAAIADDEGYGERTLLTELLAKKYGESREKFREAVFKIYEKTEQSAVAHVASCSVEVSEAARQGDACARQILKEAGEALGIQTAALIRKWQLPDDLPLTVSGSVWRSSRILFEAFTQQIYTQSPKRPVRIPPFEPVIGFLLKHYRDVTGSYTKADREKFLACYPEFSFEPEWIDRADTGKEHA